MGTGAGALAVGLAGCSTGQGTETPSPTTSPTATDTPEPETVGPSEDIPRGGTFTLGTSSPPRGMNPLSTSSAYSWMILEHLVEGGTTLDPVTNEVKPWVYTDWTVENVESGEPDAYFSVRDGLTWNDGESFGLDDVLFTYEYLMEQKPGRYLSSINVIDGVEEASNDFDVHLSMNKPIGTWDSSQLQLPLLPKHEWEGVSNFNEKTPGQEGKVVGLGWGTLTQFDADTAAEVTFRDPEEYKLTNLDWVKEHPNLLNGGPFLDTVRFKMFSGQAKLTQAYFNGDIDSFYGSIPGSEVEKVRNTDGLDLQQGQDSGYGYVAYNLRRVPFDDIVFRQAIRFLWDDIYWTQRLNRNLVLEGDFVMPPGYQAVRPEFESEDAKILSDPATQAFTFREAGAGVPDLAGIREFLTNGQFISGESGTFVGQEYPGSLTGATATQTSPRHTYSFGEVKSEVLKEYGADQEIYVDGKTITEIHGRPLQYRMYPPQLVPELTKMDENYTQNMLALGIPVTREVQTFNTLIGIVYAEESFDMYHMGWSDLSPFGVGSLYGLFHSDNADDHTKVEEGHNKKNTTQFYLNNPMGYGLFDHAGADDLISSARTEMDGEKRNAMVREAVEQIYLDSVTDVFDYDKVLWPVNSADYEGFLEGITDPGGASLGTQFFNIHQKE